MRVSVNLILTRVVRRRKRVYSFIYHLFLILIFSNELVHPVAAASDRQHLITNSNHDNEITFRVVDKSPTPSDRYYYVVDDSEMNETQEVFRAKRDGNDDNDHQNSQQNLEQISNDEHLTTNTPSFVDLVTTISIMATNGQANSTCHMTQPLSDEELNKQYYSVSNIIRMVVLSVVYSAIIIFTLVGNMLVILAVVIVRKLHSQDNANNYLIVSLAVSDLLVGVLAMPLAFYVDLSKGNKWYLGAILCDLWTLSDVLLCTASILNLCAISIDRYFIILHAMKYTQKRNARLMFLMILVVWLLSATISIPPLFGWGKPSKSLKETYICQVSSDLKYQIYATLFAFYLPLIVMIIIYINIFRAAAKIKKREAERIARPQLTNNTSEFFHHRSSHNSAQNEPLLNKKKKSCTSSKNGGNGRGRQEPKNSTCSATNSIQYTGGLTIPNSTSSNEEVNSGEGGANNFAYNNHHGQHVNKSKFSTRRLTQVFSGISSKRSSQQTTSGKNQKATRTLGIIMGSFILCWVPFFILAVVKPIPIGNGCSVGAYIPQWLDSLLLWLGYFNSALNPIIYAVYNREFRRPFIEILCFRCRGINGKLREKERMKMYRTNFGPNHHGGSGNGGSGGGGGVHRNSASASAQLQGNAALVSHNTNVLQPEDRRATVPIIITPSDTIDNRRQSSSSDQPSLNPQRAYKPPYFSNIDEDSNKPDDDEGIDSNPSLLDNQNIFGRKINNLSLDENNNQNMSFSSRKELNSSNDSSRPPSMPPPPIPAATSILASMLTPLATSTPPTLPHQRQPSTGTHTTTVSSTGSHQQPVPSNLKLDDTLEEETLNKILHSIQTQIEPGRKNSIESSTMFQNSNKNANNERANNKLWYLKRLSEIKRAPPEYNKTNSIASDNINLMSTFDMMTSSIGMPSLDDSLDQSTCSIFDQVEKSLAGKLANMLASGSSLDNSSSCGRQQPQPPSGYGSSLSKRPFNLGSLSTTSGSNCFKPHVMSPLVREDDYEDFETSSETSRQRQLLNFKSIDHETIGSDEHFNDNSSDANSYTHHHHNHNMIGNHKTTSMRKSNSLFTSPLAAQTQLKNDSIPVSDTTSSIANMQTTTNGPTTQTTSI